MATEGRWQSLDSCACGCGKQVRAAKYHSDCANECKCGCGGRARYAYKPGHRPEVVCKRCGKVFTPAPDSPKSQPGADREMCATCRRHVARGGPLIKDTSLAYHRKMQKESPEGRRWCCGCERYRLVRFFGSKQGGYYSRCRPCHTAQLRARAWLKKFGITPDQYESIKDVQGGKCAICQVATGEAKALAVDHDHRHCGSQAGCPTCVRGLLCGPCNQIVGWARDNPVLFLRAMEYLLDPPAQKVLAELRNTVPV